MSPKNLRNYEPTMATGKDATASDGPISGQAIRRTKAENETNETKEAYSKDASSSTNLGGKNTGS